MSVIWAKTGDRLKNFKLSKKNRPFQAILLNFLPLEGCLTIVIRRNFFSALRVAFRSKIMFKKSKKVSIKRYREPLR